MKRILDRGFKYTPAAKTDIRRLFQRVRAEQKAAAEAERIAAEAAAAEAKRIQDEAVSKTIRMKSRAA